MSQPAKFRVFLNDNEIAVFNPLYETVEFHDGDLVVFGRVDGVYGRSIVAAFARGTWTYAGVME